MTTLQWPLLTSASFEALVQTILFYEDPKLCIFNRPGPDGAQDAKSGDGKTVYQAKFHATDPQNSSHAFLDAKQEFEKIKKYQSENDSRWHGVEHWVLACPVTFGSQDDEKWKDEIVPLFKAIGIHAEIWPSGVLEAKIIQQPELKEVFFEGANRCFLSLPEFRNHLLNDRLSDLGLKINCIGREKELNIVKSFLLDPEKKLLIIVGESGIGKTRLLYESGWRSLDEQSNRQVLWGQVNTMGTSEHWFKAIHFQIPTLALIDGLDSLDYEHSLRILRTLREQILSPQSKWKAIISVPSRDWLDGITNHSRYKTDAEPITLGPLSKENAKQMGQSLLQEQRPDIRGAIQEKIAEDIASHSHAIPLWIATGTSILSEEGNLLKTIKDPYGIAKAYLKNSLKNFTEKEIEDVLFWVATYQPVQKSDQNFIGFVSRMSAVTVSKIETLLMKAEDQKIIYSYGISKRLIKIVPQGLADNIVYKKLLSNSGSPTRLAQNIFSELLDHTEQAYEPQKLIHAFGKVGFHSEEFKKLLRQFSEKIISHIRKGKNVTDLKRYFDFSKSLATYEQERYLTIIEEFRIKANVPDQTIKVKYLPTYTVTYKKEVQVHLARAVYDAAPYFHDDNSRKLVLDEMIALCRNEFDWFSGQERERRNNEDKGGLRKLSDILFMGSPYLHGYEKVARELAVEYLKLLEKGPSDAKEIKIIEAVIKPQIKAERRTTHWFEDKIVWETRAVFGYPAETRKFIVDTLHQILNNKAGLGSLELCLSLLAESHHEANGASLGRWLNPPSDQAKNEYFNECRDNLNLILGILPKLSLEESELARKIWDWNLRFDERAELKKIAAQCEALRNSNLDGLDLSVFSYNRWDEEAPKDTDKRIARISTSLSGKNEKEIHSYLDQALTLEASNHTGQHVTELARIIGKNYFEKTGVQKYLSSSLKEKKLIGKKYGHFQIAITLIASQCELLRKKSNGSSKDLSLLIESYIRIIPSNSNKVTFLNNLYADRHGTPFCTQDLNLILKYRPLFTKAKEYSRYFHLLGSIFFLEPKKIKKMVENLWVSTPKDQRTTAYEGFLNKVRLFRDESSLTPYRKWFFEQTVWIDDSDRLEHTFRIVGIPNNEKCSLDEFYQIILKRLKNSALEKKSSDYKVLPHDEFLNWVEHLDDKIPITEAKKIFGKYLTLESKKNWQINYYLPQVLSRLDPHGLVLPTLIANKIGTAKSLKAKKNWLRYAAYYSERSAQWRTIVLPTLQAARVMDRETQISIYSLINSNLSHPSSWVGSAADHWQAQVAHAEKELQEEKDQDVRNYLEWKVEGIRRQRDHFVQWEEED